MSRRSRKSIKTSCYASSWSSTPTGPLIDRRSTIRPCSLSHPQKNIPRSQYRPLNDVSSLEMRLNPFGYPAIIPDYADRAIAVRPAIDKGCDPLFPASQIDDTGVVGIAGMLTRLDSGIDESSLEICLAERDRKFAGDRVFRRQAASSSRRDSVLARLAAPPSAPRTSHGGRQRSISPSSSPAGKSMGTLPRSS